MSSFVHVAVAVIVRGNENAPHLNNREVLISRRHADSHQGGLWEFPGGKVEAGETVLQALCRELQEELGIKPDSQRCHPLKKIHYHYDDKSVLLDIWRVNAYEGVPTGLEGQAVEWRAISALELGDFPAANGQIIKLLQLPDRLAISPEFDALDTLDALQCYLQGLVEQGIRLLQLRQHQRDDESFARLASHAAVYCRKNKIQLIINRGAATSAVLTSTAGVGADGYHVNSQALMQLDARPVAANKLCSASCHTLAELKQAEQLALDFVTLSPVKPTQTHPGSDTLGWAEFARLANAVSVPVYALGGLNEADLETAMSSGAIGIAAIRAFARNTR